MRVLVTGAYGLIGSACLARLHADGHNLVGAGRAIAAARRRYRYAQWIEADFARLTDAAAWQPLLAGLDAVVNCVGVLQDSPRDDLQRIQFDGAVALFDACAAAGIRRVVHISAIGAETDSASAFSRTKAAAEAHLKALALDWAILRPALLLAPAVYGGSAMLRGVAGFPACVPVIAADARLQVIGAGDVADTVARALAPGAPGKVVWDLAHPQVHTLAEIATAIRSWLGFRPAPVLRLPDALGRLVAALADAIGWLGWRSAARSTALAQLTSGVIGDPQPWMAATGMRPQSLDDILAARPSNVQDRWFARLYWLKPLAIVALAGMAISTGVAALVSSLTLAAMVLPGVSFAVFGAYVLPGLVYGAIELIIGIGLLVRRMARFALIAMLVVTALWTADHLIMAWQFMLNYFGAFPSDIPMLLATLFTLAILDER